MALTKVTSAVIKDATITDADIGSTLTSAISGSTTALSSSIATRFDSRESDMTLATASIAAITASLGQPVNTDSNVTFGTITSGDINSSGTITATEIHTTFVSSSIAVASGSNNFGDATDDHHSFTGSLSVSGSGTITGSLDVDGTTNLDNTDIDGTLTVDGARSGDFLTKLTSTNQYGLLVKTTGTTSSHDLLKLDDNSGTMFKVMATGATTVEGSLTVNESGGDNDFRVEGNNDANVLFVEGATDRVGIGHVSPLAPLHISKDVTQVSGSAASRTNAGLYLNFDPTFGSNSLTAFAMSSSFATVGAYGLQAANSAGTTQYPLALQPFGGQVLIGCGKPTNGVVGFNEPALSIEGTNFRGLVSIIEHQNDISGGVLAIGKSRGTVPGAATILADNDVIGRLAYVSADGVDFRTVSAEIRTLVAGTPDADNVPGELEFRTNDGTSVDPTTRMKIGTSGIIETISGSAQGGGMSMKGGQVSYSTLGIHTGGTNTYTPTDANHINTAITIDFPNANDSVGGIRFRSHGGMEGFFGYAQDGSAGQGDFVFQGYNGSAYAELMRITQEGNVHVGKTVDSFNTVGISLMNDGRIGVKTDGQEGLNLNRAQDGNLAEFRSADTAEGTISLAGSTVSYNAFLGAHWSELSGSSFPTNSGSLPNIIRGTVVSTIDEISSGHGGRLAKFKITDTENDTRVYGVFGNWNYDDDTGETQHASIHSLGAGVVRVTGSCVGGDLLVSAGDGCAKVNNSGTLQTVIGKVTANTSGSATEDRLIPAVFYCG